MKHILVSLITLLLVSCGFHLRGEATLAPPLHRLYLQSADPYSYLTRNLQQYLKMSHVQLVPSPQQASTILVLSKEHTSETLLSVSGTNQTRQYRLRMTITFEITAANGRILIEPQTLAEERILTVQQSQILGSSNEANLFYQQMRLALVNAIMNRLASNEITQRIEYGISSRTSPS